MFITMENTSNADAATCENPRTVGRAPNDLGDKIMALDLGPIMFKLASKRDGQGWPTEKVLHVEGEYRKFLILCAEMPGEPIVPSKEVDEMWHTHILDTAKYATDCDSAFGYFLHHFPYLGLRNDQDASALLEASMRTKQLYHNRFGSLIAAASMGDCTPCTACASPSLKSIAQTSEAADCMTGCGSVACSPSSCTSNASNGSIDLVSRPTFELA